MIRALAPVATLLLSAAILLAGQGLQGTLLPVRAGLEDFSTFEIGTLGAFYFFGFTMGCLRGGDLVRRVGHIRVFLAMSAMASATPLLHGMVVHPLVWNALRFVSGFCLAVLYVVIESWLNERATNENRGIIFSTYAMITLTVMAGGQLINLLYDPLGWQLFVITSILFSIGAVPIALSSSQTPNRPKSTSVDIPALLTVSPSGTFGCFAAGLANGAFWSLTPVYAAAAGNVTTMAALLMAAAVVGGAISQWPLGLLSDAISRRKVLVGIALSAAAIGVALALTAGHSGPGTALVLISLWGAMAFPLYTVAVAYANDYADPTEFVKVSGGLLFVYGIGAIVGPFIASMVMDWRGGGTLFLFTSIVHVLLILVVAVRFLLERNQADQPVSFGDALSAAQTKSQVYEEEMLRDYEEEPGR
jgi:MFS family permease